MARFRGNHIQSRMQTERACSDQERLKRSIGTVWLLRPWFEVSALDDRVRATVQDPRRTPAEYGERLSPSQRHLCRPCTGSRLENGRRSGSDVPPLRRTPAPAPCLTGQAASRQRPSVLRFGHDREMRKIQSVLPMSFGSPPARQPMRPFRPLSWSHAQARETEEQRPFSGPRCPAAVTVPRLNSRSARRHAECRAGIARPKSAASMIAPES